MSPLDPRIILGVQPVQVQNPFEAMQTIAQLQGMREQSEARRLAGEEARQKAKDAAAVRQILTESGGDMDLALPRLRQIVPEAALKMETEIHKARKEKFDAAKSDIDARVAGVNFGANVAALGVQNPARIPALRTYLQGVSAEVAPLVPQSDDPAEWQEFHHLLLSGKDRIELAQKNLEHFLKGEYHQALGGSLSAARNAEEWDRGVQTYLAFGGPKVVAEEFGSYSPENVARAAQLAIPQPKRTELAGQAATREQSAHSPIYREWQDYQAQGGTLDFNAYQTMDANRRRSITNINTGTQAVPGNFNLTGEGFLQTIPLQWRTTVKKIAAYDEDPTKVASMRGGMRETLMQWVNQVNPGYDASEFANRSPTRKAFTTGTQGKQITNINTAIGHIDQLTTVAAALQTGGFVPGNKAWNAIRTMFGEAQVTNFDTLKDALAGEVAGVLSQSGATVSGIAEARAKISAANSPTQLAGYVNTLIPIMGSKLASLDYQYHQAMGADDSFSALSPDAKRILEKHGFDPTHPTLGGAGAGTDKPFKVVAPDGNTYGFDTAAQLAAFKTRAGIP